MKGEGRAAVLWGYVRRMHGYLREMFPVPRHALFAALAALGVDGFVRTIHAPTAALGAGAVIHAAWNIFATLLMLRLMDELKDAEIDRQLFPERPLPSGRVLESDIRWSLGALMALYALTNHRPPQVALSALLVLVYAVLMFKRFFAAERLKGSLPLTLATHTPIVPLMFLQAVLLLADGYGTPPSRLAWLSVAPYVVMLWLGMLGWELARKIRAAEEETEYVTYSRLFGRAGAVAAAAAVQTVAAGIGTVLAVRYGRDALYIGLLWAGWVVCCGGYVRFLSHPDPRTSRLKPFAAAFLITLLLAQVYGFVLVWR